MEENVQLIQSSSVQEQKHTKNVIDALINESKIMYEGLNNQEFLDYCFVKGACAQTVPLALLLPVGLFLGIINILTKSVANVIAGGSVFSNFVFVVLQICALCIILFLLLKACEVIPKKIENPLLFGRVTTYTFMCLQITMGVLVVEKIIDGEAYTFHTSQFWVVFALVIWEKVLALFIYDFKIRFATFLFLYIYYAFRISSESYQWSYNLIKACVYIAIELVLVIDRELKNMAEYQLENNVHKKSTLKEMVPPLKMFQQQSLLESFLKVFPVVIFDQTKELLNISAQTLKILGQEDLVQAERQLRKLEVIEVFNKAEQGREQQNRLARQAKFGSSCGVNEKGELLHSLINGPALQQIRNQQQDLPRLQPSGQLETLLNDLMKGDQDELKGLLMLKVSKEKNQKIYLFLDDVTELVKLQLDKSSQVVGTTDFSDINNLCCKIRQAASTSEPLLQTSFLNIETKNCYVQQMPLRVNYRKINFEQFAQNLTDYYKPRIQSVKFYVKNLVNLSTEFYSDDERIKQIIDTIMENSIQKTKEGFIGITIENDPRPNQVQVTIQDTGSGIPLDELNQETNNKFSSLFVANYLSKILGQSYYNQKIKGYIASKGLRITTLQECGSQISFSIRNMTFDQNNNGFLLDENFEEEETNSDEILDRYLVDDETQNLKRMKKPIKFILMKPELKKPIAIAEERGMIKRPQLKGMMKLQESGRLKSLTSQASMITQAMPLQIDQLGLQPQQQCTCSGILVINSDYCFEKIVKDLRVITCVENEALKIINIKLKENPCIPIGCNAYKRVIINCSNSKVNYEDLIRKLQTLIKNLNVSVLHYQPWGEILPNLTYYQMPTALDMLMN